MLVTLAIVTPLAVAIGVPEAVLYKTTLQEGTLTDAAASVTPLGIKFASLLNKDGVDIQGTARPHLSWCNSTYINEDIMSWHSQDRVLLSNITDR